MPEKRQGGDQVAPRKPSTPSPEMNCGPNEAAVRGELRQLTDASPALSAIAITLAQTLDVGAGMATAAVAKQLVATLEILNPKEHDGDALDDLIARLSTPLGNST